MYVRLRVYVLYALFQNGGNMQYMTKTELYSSLWNYSNPYGSSHVISNAENKKPGEAPSAAKAREAPAYRITGRAEAAVDKARVRLASVRSRV